MSATGFRSTEDRPLLPHDAVTWPKTTTRRDRRGYVYAKPCSPDGTCWCSSGEHAERRCETCGEWRRHCIACALPVMSSGCRCVGHAWGE